MRHSVSRISRRLTVAVALALALMVAGRAPARADGDDFFIKSDKPLMSQLIFVGAVKDDGGNYVRGALVTWTAVVGQGDEQDTSFAGTYTDVIGRYRTMDVARVVALNGFDLDPARVEVTVSKPGYVMTRRLKRTRQNQVMGLIEIDFEMRRAPSQSGQ